MPLGVVSRRLEKALRESGYDQFSYYALEGVPHGFALVTQLEQIEEDGKPAGVHRWHSELQPLSRENFSLGAYLRRLFRASPGFYRVIAFLVADRPFLQDKEKTVAKEEAQEWVFGGLNQLPADIKRDVWTDNHACTALVYEFHQPAVGEDVSVRAPSPVSGKQHLQRSEILASLKRTRP